MFSFLRGTFMSILPDVCIIFPSVNTWHDHPLVSVLWPESRHWVMTPHNKTTSCTSIRHSMKWSTRGSKHVVMSWHSQDSYTPLHQAVTRVVGVGATMHTAQWVRWCRLIPPVPPVAVHSAWRHLHHRDTMHAFTAIVRVVRRGPTLCGLSRRNRKCGFVFTHISNSHGEVTYKLIFLW